MPKTISAKPNGTDRLSPDAVTGTSANRKNTASPVNVSAVLRRSHERNVRSIAVGKVRINFLA